MLAPQSADPKKRYISIGLVIVIFIVSGWLLWRQFAPRDEVIIPVGMIPGAVNEDVALYESSADKTAVDLSFLESSQFLQLRGEPVQVATSTERSVNPFAQP